MLFSKVGLYLHLPSPQCFDRRANPPVQSGPPGIRHSGRQAGTADKKTKCYLIYTVHLSIDTFSLPPVPRSVSTAGLTLRI